MTTVENKTIGEIVAEDYRTAQIFKNHNIDFCCKGNRSVKEVCETNDIDPEVLIREIETIQQENRETNTDYQSWPLNLLADYIEQKHHRYVEEQIPVLKTYLEKLCRVHGNRHPDADQRVLPHATCLRVAEEDHDRVADILVYRRTERECHLRHLG